MGLFDKFRNKNNYQATAHDAQVEANRRVAKTGFKVFLEQKANTAWIADYITDQNEIHILKAHTHMSHGGYAISDYSEEAFRKLVGAQYARYMGVAHPEPSDVALIERIHNMPLNITIRRVKPKQSGNNWSVEYLGGTKYYGISLIYAIDRLISRNPKVAAKFEQNKEAAVEKA